MPPSHVKEKGETTSKPNLILISLDTLRADRLSVYGYSRNTSPHLEELSRESVTFENFYYNGGGTLPSHMSMMTSLHPHVHGVLDNEKILEPERVTLAEVLRSDGYTTAAFTDAGWMKGKFGFHQGFDLYDDEGGRFATIMPKVLDWIREHEREEFFLFVHSYDVHSEWGKLPYSCPYSQAARYVSEPVPDFDGCRDGKCASKLLKWINTQTKNDAAGADNILSPDEVEYISDLYDGCINYADKRVAELLTLLKELKIYDETMIVITSDHGEEFFEHGYFLHDQGGYETVSHIPLILKFPFQEHAGTRVDSLGSLVDLMPTVLDILNLDTPVDAQGVSLKGATQEGFLPREDVVMVKNLRTDDWKFILRKQELYDIKEDSGEVNNLASAKPDVVKSLTHRLKLISKEHRRAVSEFREKRSPMTDKNQCLSPKTKLSSLKPWDTYEELFTLLATKETEPAEADGSALVIARSWDPDAG